MNEQDWLKRALKWTPPALTLLAAILLALPFNWIEVLFSDEPSRIRAALTGILIISAAIYAYLGARESDVERKLDSADKALVDEARALRDKVSDETKSVREDLARQRDAILALSDKADLIAKLKAQIENLPDPNARKLTSTVGPHIVTLIKQILTKDFFVIKGGVLFQEFYRATFKQLNGPCDIIATALADYKYHWGRADLNDLFREFTRKPGCSLTRIFILKDRALLDTKDAQEIMRGQAEAGVNVFWILREDLTEPMQLVVADKQHTFSWELSITDDNSIETVRASWDPDTADDLHRYGERLLHDAKPFAPNAALMAQE